MGFCTACYFSVHKRHNSVKKAHRVIALGQIIALVMTNKCVKFHAGSCNNKEVMTNIKVFRAYTNDDDSNNTTPSTMTIG